MTIYIIEPDPISPSRRFGLWLTELGYDVRHLSMPYEQDTLAEVVDLLKGVDRSNGQGPQSGNVGVTAVVHCGGRQNSLSSDENPWINDSMELYRQCQQLDIPVFGICLGFQILAHTFGGQVELASKEHNEEGPVELILTEHGMTDPVFSKLTDIDGPLWGYESHFDCVTKVPEGATLLAHSVRAPVEAFRLGSALGTQFHPECSPDEIEVWARNEFGEESAPGKRREAEAVDPTLRKIGRILLQGFVEEISRRWK